MYGRALVGMNEFNAALKAFVDATKQDSTYAPAYLETGRSSTARNATARPPRTSGSTAGSCPTPTRATTSWAVALRDVRP
jgi:hypothetical protein